MREVNIFVPVTEAFRHGIKDIMALGRAANDFTEALNRCYGVSLDRDLKITVEYDDKEKKSE